jgi:NAD(P)H-dependent FMN reductase
MLKVGLIVGSTRLNRFADTPVRWLVEGAAARSDLRLTVLDQFRESTRARCVFRLNVSI